MRSSRTIVGTLFVLAMFLPALASGQSPAPPRSALEEAQTVVSAGYVGNMPNMFLGAGGMFLRGDWGLYADYKWAHEADPRRAQQFIDGLTPREAEAAYSDERRHSFDRWRSMNVALVRRIGGNAFYFGAGHAHRDTFVEFYSAEVDRGYGGYYWVEDDEAESMHVNVIAGGILPIGRVLAVQFGYESRPSGIMLGVMLTNPFSLF